MRTVLVSGATGFVGAALCDRLAEKGWSIIALSRGSRMGIGPLRFVTWSPEDPASAVTLLAHEMEKVSAVINLAGEPLVAGRWTQKRKRLIMDSRVSATKILVDAMAKASRKPAVLINASAIGYYGSHTERPLDESSPPGSGFLAVVCAGWESEARKAEAYGVRVVRLRIGIVLGREGGALSRMLPPFRLGLGGPLGSGEQWMSWIHIQDLSDMIAWALELGDIEGPVNATAPQPVTNEEFSRTLARILKRPCIFRAPGFLLSMLLGEMAGVLLEGQKVVPGVAANRGFRFRFPELRAALQDVL